MPFVVQALQNGFYSNTYQFKGSKFVVQAEEHFSKKWMKKLPNPKAEKSKAKPKKDSKASAASAAVTTKLTQAK
jgi:hypothetical protein